MATVGEVIAGKYRIEREIGRGGMGLVLLATHVDLEQPVAVKVLHEDSAYDADAIARFIREARAAGKIQSDHVARVMDAGVLPEGGAYIVMELLDGKDLADVLHDEGPLDISVAVGHVLEACDALAAAHAVGIVHRDLKPANLFLARKPDETKIVKVLDFGVSKMAAQNTPSAPSALTQSGQIFGSPSYMAPEQLRSAADVDARADIWSLGVVLYELVTASLPFPARTMADMMAAVVRDPPQPLAQVRADVPPALEAILVRCLEKEPSDRYTNVGELARALAPFSPGNEALVARIERVSARSGASGVPSLPAPSSLRIDVVAPEEAGETEHEGNAEEPQDTPSEAPLSRSLGSGRVSSLSGRSSRWVVLGLAPALAAAIGFLVTLSHRAPPAPTPASARAPEPPPAAAPTETAQVLPAVAPASAAPSPSAARTEVTINVSSAPKETRVYRGAELLGTVPGPLVFERGQAPIELRFVAEGYTSAEVTVVPNVDRVLAVELKPTKPTLRTQKAGTGPKGKVPGDLEPF
ncbi:serine/threonine-protein kinase [Polyangium jinanense]|uniref:Serine/threonine protein kinase n=1 Tax=Polyangium jinanense TaxID=2829994 RepID=A0A9X3WZT6_9BACT|nr:serine/threonine-protein kinase [Polyangium jinanense]MDC3954782.1 serine/threonine protein kinase [Polyangium jinanense]MDC3981447.1 serine/threonine protein kinase [Polyangium jinanense]